MVRVLHSPSDDAVLPLLNPTRLSSFLLICLTCVISVIPVIMSLFSCWLFAHEPDPFLLSRHVFLVSCLFASFLSSLSFLSFLSHFCHFYLIFVSFLSHSVSFLFHFCFISISFCVISVSFLSHFCHSAFLSH